MTSVRTVALLTSVAGWRGSATSYLKIARGMGGLGWHARAIVGGEVVRERFVRAGIDAEVVLYDRTGLREARDLARRLAGASVVIADTPRDLRNAVLARLFGGPPVVYRYNLSYRPPHRGVVERTYLRAAAGCVFQSRMIAGEFVRAYTALADRPRWIIPNGYDATMRTDPAVVEALRRRLSLPAAHGVVLCGTMLASRKGHDLLLDAMARVADRRPIVLVICGTGGEESAVADRASRSSMRVIFTGMLDEVEMQAAYRLADVVVHAAEREIFPNAVAEAMMAGRTVVAVDSGATGEVMGNAGILVPPGDVDALARAACDVLDDPVRARTIGEAAADRIATTFPLGRMIDGYARVLDAVGRGATRASR